MDDTMELKKIILKTMPSQTAREKIIAEERALFLAQFLIANGVKIDTEVKNERMS